MNERIKKVFDILGIEPNEKFRISFKGNENYIKNMYYIDEELNVFCFTEYGGKLSATITIRDFLRKHYEIIKLPKVTEKEQLAIDYLKECGYKWIAKDKDDKVFAFRSRPLKNFWSGWESASYVPDSLIVEIPISFISSEDEEPYYIGD